EVVCGIDPSPPEDAAAFLNSFGVAYKADLDRALRDSKIEAVVLATPHALHESQVLAVVAAGKNVFCEKPLTMTGDGARRVLAATAKAGRVLGIGHERRYEPAFEELGRIIRSGEIGRILLLEANVSHDVFRNIDRSNWRLSSAHAPAGMMTAVGIHLTDLFVHFAGPPAEVRARTASLVFEPPAEDFVTAGIVFKSGARATITSLSATPFYGRFTVFGDKGWVEIVSEANVDKGKPTILTRGDAEGRRSVAYEAVDTVSMNFEAWADAVEGKKAYRFTSDELLQNVLVFEAIVTSSRQGGAAITL
ncbi:MAG: Gfo/Idh/MocA family protein, partial [Roseiarcus sp.]